MPTGMVTQWNGSEGMIKPNDGGPSVYVHADDVQGYMNVGDNVQYFMLTQNDGRRKAINVVHNSGLNNNFNNNANNYNIYNNANNNYNKPSFAIGNNQFNQYDNNNNNYQQNASYAQFNNQQNKPNPNNSSWESFNNNNNTKQQRADWRVGSKCEIFSKGHNCWCKAEIVCIKIDNQGEWLVIKYLNGQTKDVQRGSNIVRPIAISHNANNNNNNFTQLSQSTQHHQYQLRQQAQLHQQQLEQQRLQRQVISLTQQNNTLQNQNMINQSRANQIKNQNQMMKQKLYNDYKKRNDLANKLKKREYEMKQNQRRNQNMFNDIGIDMIWEWQENNNKWKAYTNWESKNIEKLMINQSYTFSGKNNSQQYKIIKLTPSTAIQINSNTNRKRKCRQKAKLASKPKWQWKNGNVWNAYDQKLNDIIEKLSFGQIHTYTYHGNKQTYNIKRIDANNGEQVNTYSNVKRKIRRIEGYGKYKHAVQYPKHWKMRKNKKYGDCVLVDLPLATNATAKQVVKDFNSTLPNRKVIKVEAIQNRMLFDQYYYQKQGMLKLHNDNLKKLNIQKVWHGTKAAATMDAIMKEGWRKEFNGSAAYGYGTYFAPNVSYNYGYAANVGGTPPVYKIFYCEIIVGESCLGNGGYTLKAWPKNPNTNFIYDTLVSSLQNPQEIVIHNDHRAYPMFVVSFQ